LFVFGSPTCVRDAAACAVRSPAQFRFRHGIALLTVVVSALALTGCGEQNAYVEPPPPKVIVAKPLQKPAISYVEATGNTAPLKSVDLEARVQGYLEEINFTDGDEVKDGTLLFSIQRNTYEAQLEQAKASLASAQATALNAEINYNRVVTLGRQGNLAVTQQQIDNAKATLDSANASVENAKAGVELASINLGYTEVRAPFDGVVTRHLVDVGALVGYSGPTKLATILQVRPIYVYFTVGEDVVLRFKERHPGEGRPRAVDNIPVDIGLQTENGYPHRGKLDYVSPQVNSSTGTLDVRAIFDNADRELLPGLFVRVRVPDQRIESALWVEETAIGQSQLGDYLLVVGKDNIVEQRQVKTGRREDELRVIESGITANDWIVTDGIQRAVPGQKVNPEEKAMKTAAAGQ
jgi:multidrug efflux system membrane fusion protein